MLFGHFDRIICNDYKFEFDDEVPLFEVLDKDGDGNVIVSIPMTEADDDWIRAERLRKFAEEGDEEAARKLKKMQDTLMSGSTSSIATPQAGR